MTEDENDRFGMPASTFDAALDSHGRDNPVFRIGMYVPTRGEVSKLPADDLRLILIDWMWESPSELIPNNEQISDVRSILTARADADDDAILRLIAECDAYLKV